MYAYFLLNKLDEKMKEFIEFKLRYYSRIFQTPEDVLEHLFATLGNGIELDNKGYLIGNYKSNEPYHFGTPKALNKIYPWSDYSKPYEKFAGCRDVGFKDAAKHFIECIKVTPDTVKYIDKWKENIDLVEDSLLNTPTIQDPYDIEDMEKFLQDIKEEKKTKDAPLDGTVIEESNSVYKIWFFDVQWSDCPESVEKEVISAWNVNELGNDNYIWKIKFNEDFFKEYPRIYFWLKHKGVAENEEVIIHWWW